MQALQTQNDPLGAFCVTSKKFLVTGHKKGIKLNQAKIKFIQATESPTLRNS